MRHQAQKRIHTMPNAEAITTEITATVAEQGATVAPEKASSKKAATQKKGAPKGQKPAKGGRPKHGLKIESTKTESGDRVYQIKK
jgi:hypothetical protein